MAADASLAYGARLYYSTDGSTYTELTDIVEIGSPGEPEAPDVDVTPINPSTAYREFKSGLLNAGEFSFKQHWNKTRFTTLRGRLRTSTYWRLVFPDNATPANASKAEFVGPVKKCTTDPMNDADDEIHIMCTVKVSGAITWTEGS